MSSDENLQDSVVIRNLAVVTTVLFGFFLAMVFLARSIVY